MMTNGFFDKVLPGLYKYEVPSGTYFAVYNGRTTVELRFHAAGTPKSERGELLGSYGKLADAIEACRNHVIFGSAR